MSLQPKRELMRVHGSRSNSGCQTCRLRRVKCDEQKPVCRRCTVAKRSCVYASCDSFPAPTKFMVYGLTREPNPSLQLAPHERRALHHFQCRTKGHIQGPFRSKFWSTVVPMLVDQDHVVRQAVIALSNMHEHYLDDSSDASLNSALHHYQKTLRQIVRLKAPEASFESVLTACVILHSFECLRGAFDEATRHAAAGVKMIVDRQYGDAWQNEASIVSKDVLSELFLELQQHVMEANDNNYHAQFADLSDPVTRIPEQFSNVEEALPHFHHFMYRLLSLFEKAEIYHEKYDFIPGSISPVLEGEYHSITATYNAWSRALSNIESVVHSNGRQQHEGYLVLKIFQLSFKIDLNIFVHGETAYDDFKAENFGILKLIEVLLQIQDDHGGRNADTKSTSPQTPITFVSSLGIVSLLFEIATRTNDERLRYESMKLLRLTNRREGIWDSRVASRLAERILDLEKSGVAATKAQLGQKFLITDIQLLSNEKCKVTYGFKKKQASSFQSFWLETIRPGEGVLQTEVIDIGLS